MTRTALYRHFDADGTLLYVGISDRLSERDRHHAATSHWHGLVHRSTTEWCVSRDHAEALEAVAINFERPRFNIAKTPKLVFDGSDATASSIANAIGQRKLSRLLGVTPTAVNNAITRGAFPASWAVIVTAACDDLNMTCPASIFTFRHSDAA